MPRFEVQVQAFGRRLESKHGFEPATNNPVASEHISRSGAVVASPRRPKKEKTACRADPAPCRNRLRRYRGEPLE